MNLFVKFPPHPATVGVRVQMIVRRRLDTSPLARPILVVVEVFHGRDTPSMSDKRRAEIEAKRAKLAELRKARADRQRAETERRQSEVTVLHSVSWPI